MEKFSRQEKEVNLKELLLTLQLWGKYIYSKRVKIFIIAIIGGILGGVYAGSQKTIYKAELSFALEDGETTGGMGSYSGLASMVGIDLGNSSNGIFAGDNLIELMTSRSMIGKTLLTSIVVSNKKQPLAEFYVNVKGIRKKWDADPVMKNFQFEKENTDAFYTRLKDSVITNLYEQIIKNDLSVVRKDKKVNIITISIRSENELFSKYFTEELINVVSRSYVETKTKKAAQNLEILQHQTDSVRKELVQSMNGVASLSDVNPNPNPLRQVLLVPTKTRQVDVQANTVILQSLTPNLEMAKITLRKETPLIAIVDQPILPLAAERASKAKSTFIGFVGAAALAVLFLIIKRIFGNIMAQ